jgi:S1-C subfamily serine protease
VLYKIFIPLLFTVLSLHAFAAERSGDLYSRITRSTVEVLANGHLEASGWIADSSGYIITVSHITPSSNYEISSPLTGRINASLIAIDCGNDLALLKVDAKNGSLPALKLSQKNTSPGDEIFIFGTPMFRRDMMLYARIAKSGTGFEFYRNAKYFVEVLYATGFAPTILSGGPWVDAQGLVVGTQSGAVANFNVPQGLITSSPRKAIEQLLKSKLSSSTADFGARVSEIEIQPSEFIQKFPPRTSGLVLSNLLINGPAAKAGLKETDLIVAVDANTVSRIEHMLRYIRTKKPGDTVTFSVLQPETGRIRKHTLVLYSPEDEFMKSAVKKP